jgi:predicted TIM-barrel fold metal-dependent hydrolase
VLVDTHVHVISPDLQRFPLQPPGVNTGPWWETHPCSADLLRLLMADAGVDRAVLVQGVGAYGFDNEYTLAASKAAPEAFASVVCTDRRADDAAGTLRDLVQRGARGYRWFMVHDDARLDQPRALWDALGGLRVPVVMTFLADRLEDFAAAVPSLPPVPLAVDHCAFADLAQGIPDELAALGAFPNVYLKVSTHALRSAAKGGDPADAVAELAARFEGRIMWGSDFSQTHDVPYPELVEEGRRAAAKLADDARQAYLAGSAATLWPELQP